MLQQFFSVRTRLGKVAIWLGVATFGSIVLSLIFAAAIGGDPAVIESSPALSILATALSILFTLAGPLSFAFGVIAAFVFKDRSIWKPLIVLYILTFLLFMVGEFLFPH